MFVFVKVLTRNKHAAKNNTQPTRNGVKQRGGGGWGLRPWWGGKRWYGIYSTKCKSGGPPPPVEGYGLISIGGPPVNQNSGSGHRPQRKKQSGFTNKIVGNGWKEKHFKSVPKLNEEESLGFLPQSTIRERGKSINWGG